MNDRQSLTRIHPAAHADAYEARLKPELLPGTGKAAGYRGSYLLRRASGDKGDEIEFITTIFRDSIKAIRAVTRPDYETAVIPQR